MKSSLNILLQYTKNLEENIQALYTKLITNYDSQKTYEAPQQNLTYVSLLTSCSENWVTIDANMFTLYTQLYNMFNTPIQSKHVHT